MHIYEDTQRQHAHTGLCNVGDRQMLTGTCEHALSPHAVDLVRMDPCIRADLPI